ncbi:MAG: hypothetical protein K6G26_13285 [Lachnospiraceae bacterium]|nr:hypothetical protein [Lachnospiraceae bacterium]
MEKTRYIRVPKNQKAVKDYDNGIIEDNQVEEILLTQEVFDELYKSGVFSIINDKCDIIIDDYEDEVLTLEKVPVALEVVNDLCSVNTSNNLKELKRMLELALKYKTIVGFDF